jgi:hypothetical protein
MDFPMNWPMNMAAGFGEDWPMALLTDTSGSVWQSLINRDARLSWFALAMLVGAAITLPLLWMDPRTIRGVSVWAKPLKFMLTTAAFALTSAWLLGLIPPQQRASNLITGTVWVLIATASFEVIYISVQASLAQASHYNLSSSFHALMFSLMAFDAVALTATQAIFAWQIYLHAPVSPLPPAAIAVVLGLLLSFILGTVSGFMLGGQQPPAGESGLWLFGWQFSQGDFRPAHFLGLHAHQFLPLAGVAIQRWIPAHWPNQWGTAMLLGTTLLYSLLWTYLTQIALGVPRTDYSPSP